MLTCILSPFAVIYWSSWQPPDHLSIESAACPPEVPEREYSSANTHRQKRKKEQVCIKKNKQEIKLMRKLVTGCCTAAINTSAQNMALCENTKTVSLSDHSQLRVYVWFRCVKAISYRPVKPQYPYWNLTHT